MQYLIGDWVKNVQYTAAAIEKGVEKDEEFLHLCVMSYLTVIVFSICGPIQFGLSLMVMFSGDNSIRVNPPSLQADGKWTVVSSLPRLVESLPCPSDPVLPSAWEHSHFAYTSAACSSLACRHAIICLLVPLVPLVPWHTWHGHGGIFGHRPAGVTGASRMSAAGHPMVLRQ